MSRTKLIRSIAASISLIVSTTISAEDTGTSSSLAFETHTVRVINQNDTIGTRDYSIDTITGSSPRTGDSSLELNYKNPSPVNVSDIQQYIHNELENNVMGFAVVVNHLGGEVLASSWGAARSVNDGYSAMTVDTRMNIASVSKNITAIGLLNLLEQRGISIDTPIGKWLPQSWTRGYGFQAPPEMGVIQAFENPVPIEYLTFKNLLQHKTGLNQLFGTLTKEQKSQWGNDWDGLEYVVSLNADPGAGPSYKNANFALLRVLIAHILMENTGIPVTKDNYKSFFMTHMENVAFTLAGVYQVSCNIQDQYDYARFYNVYYPEVAGYLSGTDGDSCGGHSNFHLSARDLANIASEARYNNNILSDAQRADMDNLKLGWMGSGGDIYHHGGDLFYSFNPNAGGQLGLTLDGGYTYYRELHTCIMKMPHGYEAGLVINSNNKTGKSACGILKNAYLNAVQE